MLFAKGTASVKALWGEHGTVSRSAERQRSWSRGTKRESIRSWEVVMVYHITEAL